MTATAIIHTQEVLSDGRTRVTWSVNIQPEDATFEQAPLELSADITDIQGFLDARALEFEANIRDEEYEKFFFMFRDGVFDDIHAAPVEFITQAQFERYAIRRIANAMNGLEDIGEWNIPNMQPALVGLSVPDITGATGYTPQIAQDIDSNLKAFANASVDLAHGGAELDPRG